MKISIGEVISPLSVASDTIDDTILLVMGIIFLVLTILIHVKYIITLNRYMRENNRYEVFYTKKEFKFIIWAYIYGIGLILTGIPKTICIGGIVVIVESIIFLMYGVIRRVIFEEELDELEEVKLSHYMKKEVKIKDD